MNYIEKQAAIETEDLYGDGVHELEEYFIAGGMFVRDKIAAEIIDILNYENANNSTDFVEAMHEVLTILKKY